MKPIFFLVKIIKWFYFCFFFLLFICFRWFACKRTILFYFLSVRALYATSLASQTRLRRGGMVLAPLHRLLYCFIIVTQHIGAASLISLGCSIDKKLYRFKNLKCHASKIIGKKIETEIQLLRKKPKISSKIRKFGLAGFQLVS